MQWLTFDIETASDETWERFHALKDVASTELYPHDPLVAHDKRKARMALKSSNDARHRWLIYDGDALVGNAMLTYELPTSPSYDSNGHRAHFQIYVHPESRRRGVGHFALSRLANDAHSRGHNQLVTWSSAPDSGHLFCERFAGKAILTGGEKRLELADVDWDLVERWKRDYPSDGTPVQIEHFEDVPEADLETFTSLFTELIADVPFGDVDHTVIVTPARRREAEAHTRKRGQRWITFMMREPDGRWSTLTEFHQELEPPYQIHQELTAVHAHHRGHGRAKRIKAETLLFIRDQCPETRTIMTANAVQNAPMNAVNEHLGFRLSQSHTIYLFDLETLRSSLAAS